MKLFRACVLTQTAVLACYCLISNCSAGQLRTVALRDFQAPGAGPGVTFSGFSIPVLNDAGHVSFTGNFTGVGITPANSRALYVDRAGTALELILRADDPASEASTGVNFSGFRNPVLNESGKVSFTGFVSGANVSSVNDQGIWSQVTGGSLNLIAREGIQAPGTETGVFFNRLSEPRFNDAGHAAFAGELLGPGVSGNNFRGIWSEGSSSGLNLIARSGLQAPDAFAGTLFTSFSDPLLNNSGQIAFFASVSDSARNSGIWSEGGGNGLARVAQEGMIAPGTPGISFFNGFGLPSFNDEGHTAFRASLTGGIREGVWSEGSGLGLQQISLEGFQAPGMPNGVVFSRFSDPILNDSGKTAFVATLANGPSNQGIWSEGQNTGLELVASAGSQAPGAPTGVLFSSFSDITFNNSGQVLFTASLTGSGVNFTNSEGIWAQEPSGQLTLIARQGGTLDVNDSPIIQDLRTLSRVPSYFSNTNNNDGLASGFNDKGQLAFFASFTDGSSGIFVSNLVAIPEPTSAALVLMAIACVGARRK